MLIARSGLSFILPRLDARARVSKSCTPVQTFTSFRSHQTCSSTWCDWSSQAAVEILLGQELHYRNFWLVAKIKNELQLICNRSLHYIRFAERLSRTSNIYCCVCRWLSLWVNRRTCEFLIKWLRDAVLTQEIAGGLVEGGTFERTDLER